MTDQPTRWIEQVADVYWFPADPAEWTPEMERELVARLNCDGLRRAIWAALQQAAASQDREGQQEGAA